MTNRRDRLARALEINDQLWRLQQTRLAQAENAVSALREAEAAAFRSLGDIEPTIVLPYIANLLRDRLAAETALAQARARASESGRRMKLTEKLHTTAADLARRDEQAKELRATLAIGDVSAR
ncbi:MAG: hypothetical protein ACR652_16750 [Methylocystis sp.]|uniref:hypothetical protein n=1 Tax=Methylocystis sp. TaxID=1911079 RepID=UPI003DA5CD23